MAWVTWRQHRTALAGVAVFLGAVAVGLWIVGARMHHAYAVAAACHPSSLPVCDQLVTAFGSMDSLVANGYVLQAIPALVGAFVGAPVLARELETGTFRHAWTQGFGRWRWTLAKLVPLAVVVTTAAGALTIVLAWYYQPYFAARNQNLFLPEMSRVGGAVFDLRGVAFAAWTLAAFATGALAGILIRRVVPAIAAALASYAGLAFAEGLYLRQHYLAPTVARNLFHPPVSAWIVNQWWTKGGATASQSTVSRILVALFYRNMPAVHRSAVRHGHGSAIKAQKSQSYFDAMRYLIRHGYTQWTAYHPASRFWPFQFLEGGWLLALSVLLIAATVWLVRRRAA